jgi:hypothetical protein
MQNYESSGMAPKRAHLYVGNLSPRVVRPAAPSSPALCSRNTY